MEMWWNVAERGAVALAPALLGCILRHENDEGVTAGIITETEAYHEYDPASHSFRGQTSRNAAMFGPAGNAYVYLSYGLHRCLNVVAGTTGCGEAVLIRMLQPSEGIAIMQKRRTQTDVMKLCNGPGNLTQALGITLAHNGLSLRQGPLTILPRRRIPEYFSLPRVGISQAKEELLRFRVKK